MKTLNTKLRKNSRYYINNNKVYYCIKKKRRRRSINDLKFNLIISNLLILALSLIIAVIFLMFDIDPKFKKETVTVDYSNVVDNSIPISNHTYEVKTLTYDKNKDIDYQLSIQLGNSVINIKDYELYKQNLPNLYYPGLDYSSFQPFMDYKLIKNKSSQSYKISYANEAYTDENGFRRYKTDEDDFTIDGNDDYIVALGTFYKEKGTAGGRYLIVTSTGMYTVIAGDEKSDDDTDAMNMFTIHSDGKAGLIEWVVDADKLNREIKNKGTVTAGPVKEMQGKIEGIYKID